MVGGSGWTERYRDRWKWDKITWGSHAVDCYPGGCPLRVYVRDGKIVREEQSGTLAVVQAGVPDMNPMGCNKGACWGYLHTAPDRVTRPLKRVGERGEGKFEPVSRDEALKGARNEICTRAARSRGHSRACTFPRLGLAECLPLPS